MAKVTRAGSGREFTVLAEKLKQLEGKSSQAGWFENATYPDGTKVAYIASIQEYGVPSKSIPPRPFMRPTIAAKQNEWLGIMAKGAKAILKGTMTAEQVMGLVASQAVADVLVTITEITSPPLSPITLELRAMRRAGVKITGKTVGEAARKVAQEGYTTPSVSDKPLIDTNELYDKMTFRVQDEKGQGS